MKKFIPEVFHRDLLLKIGILWLRDIPILNYECPPLAPPNIQYHGIMIFIRFFENAWLGFSTVQSDSTGIGQELPKLPNFNYTTPKTKFSKVL